MDSIKKMLENRQYDLVIKFTEGTNDLDNLFYRLQAFLGLGNDNEALNLIKENLEIMDGRRLELMKIHFNILFAHRLYNEIKEALEYYDSLPYFSYEAEEFIKEQYTLLGEERKSNHDKYHNLSIDEIKDLLLKPSSNDEMLFVLNAIRTMNVRLFLDELQSFLISSYSDVIKTFALLILIEQKVMEEISFLKRGVVYNIVPYELTPPYCDAIYQEITKRIEGGLKDPSLTNIACELFNIYVMDIYPDEICDDETDLLVAAFLAIAHQYLNSEYDISLLADKYDVPIELLIAKIEEISEFLSKGQSALS